MKQLFLGILIVVTGGVAYAQSQREQPPVLKRAEAELVKYKRCIDAEVARQPVGTPRAAIDSSLMTVCAEEEKTARGALTREGMDDFSVNTWIGYGRSIWIERALEERKNQ
jgi:hypothetical protein